MIDPIQEFWRWWTACEQPGAAAVDRRVRAIDAGLGWEFSGGTATAGNRLLAVHSTGDPTLRALAARWAAAAVPTDGWEFLAARPASPSPLSGAVVVEGVRIDLSELRFDALPAEHRPEIDVTGVHPAFAVLGRGAARRVTELALADVLGETRVDLWIGAVTGRARVHRTGGTRAAPRTGLVRGGSDAQTPADAGAVRAPGDARRLSGTAVRRFVDDFAALECWRTWSRMGDVAVWWPLRGARWPRFDTHLAVTRASRDLVRALGGNGGIAADCVVVAWEDGGRVAHVYADGVTSAPAFVEARAGPGAVIERGYDPTLAEVRHLAGLYGRR